MVCRVKKQCIAWEAQRVQYLPRTLLNYQDALFPRHGKPAHSHAWGGKIPVAGAVEAPLTNTHTGSHGEETKQRMMQHNGLSIKIYSCFALGLFHSRELAVFNTEKERFPTPAYVNHRVPGASSILRYRPHVVADVSCYGGDVAAHPLALFLLSFPSQHTWATPTT